MQAEPSKHTLFARDPDRFLKDKNLRATPSLRLDDSSGSLQLIQEIGAERHEWLRLLVQSKVDAVCLPRSIAKQLHGFSESFDYEVAGYLMGVLHKGTFIVLGLDMLASGGASSVDLIDPVVSPPYWRCIRDYYHLKLKEQIPSFCTMLFHNHPAEYKRLNPSDSYDRAVVQRVSELLQKGEFEFLRRYTTEPEPRSAYNWIGNAELSGADLEVKASAQLLIRSSTSLHTCPEDRLACFDTFKIPKGADSAELGEVPITLFGALREIEKIDQTTIRSSLAALGRVASKLRSETRELFGSYDLFSAGLRGRELCDYDRDCYDKMSDKSRDWHHRALKITQREYDALKIKRSKLIDFDVMRWWIHEETESSTQEVGGMYTLSMSKVASYATTLISQIELPTPQEMGENRRDFFAKAWGANHRLLSDAFTTTEVPEFVIAGMPTRHLFEFQANRRMDIRQKCYTLAEWSKGSYSLFHLYHLASLANHFTGPEPGASGPGGGVVLLRPMDPMKTLGSELENCHLCYRLLLNDPRELVEYSEAEESFPVSLYHNMLDLRQPIAVIDTTELLPTYTESFIDSTRVDRVMVATYSQRLLAQKLVARVLDLFREDGSY